MTATPLDRALARCPFQIARRAYEAALADEADDARFDRACDRIALAVPATATTAAMCLRQCEPEDFNLAAAPRVIEAHLPVLIELADRAAAIEQAGGVDAVVWRPADFLRVRFSVSAILSGAADTEAAGTPCRYSVRFVENFGRYVERAAAVYGVRLH